MTFANNFRIDEINSSLPWSKMVGYVNSAGSYEGGLFSVLDLATSNSILSSWRWLLGVDAIALVATALGDIFFWSERQGAIYFLDVQRGTSTFVDRELSFFLDEFLASEEIRDRVLQENLFANLAARLGKLRYGQCYIAEPWLRLGGTGDESTYSKGDMIVYMNLVGQAVEQSMKLERFSAK